jgi:L-ribulose-5-phosphate 3-epimerase
MSSRRNFLKMATATAGVSALTFKTHAADSYKGTLCLFSKHLPEMDWPRLARSVKKLGFGGVDLTVRPGGHVLPERASEDLPKAVAAIRAEGLTVPFISTGLVSASDATARPILATAGKLGIPFFKPGYYKYQFIDVRRELDEAGREFRGLAELGKECGVQVGFHNHEGNIGGPIWDIAGVIDGMDPRWVGYYFDVRHAVAEGGVGGWKIATSLVSKRLKMLAVKDFYWEKAATGWRPKNCPLGEGAVDWKAYFKMIREAGFQGPISLHLEYEIPGATASAREENTLAAAARDLEFLKARLRESYTGA